MNRLDRTDILYNCFYRCAALPLSSHNCHIAVIFDRNKRCTFEAACPVSDCTIDRQQGIL